LVSLRFSHYVDFGGAHPNYGITGMNFGGEEIGKIRITDLMDTSEGNLQFIRRYCERDLSKESPDEEAVLFELAQHVEPYNWDFFGDFNIDKLGLTIHLTSRQGLPHVIGAHMVRIEWETLRGRLNEEFCGTKLARRLGLSAHAPI
jgi:hypothetical protein